MATSQTEHGSFEKENSIQFLSTGTSHKGGTLKKSLFICLRLNRKKEWAF